MGQLRASEVETEAEKQNGQKVDEVNKPQESTYINRYGLMCVCVLIKAR